MDSCRKDERALATIHAPVPDYRERLETPMDRFHKHEDWPHQRPNGWSLQLGDELFSPQRSTRKAALGDLANENICLSVENQTLRKLPKTGLVLFTIRTHLVPVIRWQSTPGAIAELIEMLDQMSKGCRITRARISTVTP